MFISPPDTLLAQDILSLDMIKKDFFLSSNLLAKEIPAIPKPTIMYSTFFFNLIKKNLF